MMGEDGIRQFTRFIPHGNPKIYGKSGGAVVAGKTCLETPRVYPIHLFVRGTYLLVGGLQKKEDGTLATKDDGTMLVHQAAHGDFMHEKVLIDGREKVVFNSMEECPLLEGLQWPFTFNVALENSRSIWVNKVNNVKTILKNQTLVVDGTSVHGGMTSFFNEQTTDWFPSLHMVMESSRYPKAEDSVQLAIHPETYVVPGHLRDLDDAGLMGGFDSLWDSMGAYAKESHKRKRKLSKQLRRKVELFEEMRERLEEEEEEEEDE
jgi:hypothetical protein